MLSASIKISNIDYEKTFQQIFPMVKARIHAMESKNMLIRLFQKLDDAALPVLSGVMFRLPEETKHELLVHCLNTYSARLRDKLNEEFANDTWGKCFTVGSLWLEQRDRDVFLQIGQIEADYKALLDMDLVSEKLDDWLGGFSGLAKMGAKLAVTLAPDALERKGLEILWKEDNKQRLMRIAKRTLDQHGFFMDLADIRLMLETEEPVNTVEGEARLVLTEGLETEILDALSGYLKDVVVE